MKRSGVCDSLGGKARDRAEGTIEVDFMEAFARPYPARTIARVMGAPAEDAPRLHDWSMWIQRQFDPIALADPETVLTMQETAGEFYAWVRPLIESRRDTPSDDLISNLIRTEEEGERLDNREARKPGPQHPGRRCRYDPEPARPGVRLLAADPEQWAFLRDDPQAAAPLAAREALRFEPITPFTARLLTEDVEYRDVTFPANSPVMICSFTGNRDPEAFTDPEVFDVTAERGKARILTFGAGIHYCVGANIATAELEEALALPRLAHRNDRTCRPAGPPDSQRYLRHRIAAAADSPGRLRPALTDPTSRSPRSRSPEAVDRTGAESPARPPGRTWGRGPLRLRLSSNKPFCDGSHLDNFKDPETALS